MLASIHSAALLGIDAHTIVLEVDYSRQGMPSFTMVGLAEGAVRESKERVLAALKNSGFKLSPARITVNLAPADMRKEGSAYDLPLAMGLLIASGSIETGAADGYFLAGELSLTGELKPVPGVLPLAIRAREEGAKGLLVPAANAQEAAVVQGLAVYGLASAAQAARFLSGEESLSPVAPDPRTETGGDGEAWLDFAEVKGQEHAKRAMEIAAAGGHNILLMGPPGSGKTMLARRIPSILPPLSFDEALEVTKIYSVAGSLPPGRSLISTRPFRSPHHTISDAGLIGGGSHPRPGEVSMAHRGVLFLDELPEFKKSALEVLRQPLEEGWARIARAAISLSYPAGFMLVAAMNPCPCGYFGDPTHSCACDQNQVRRYRGRISGPLLDRIDLHVEVPAVPYKDLKAPEGALGSAQIRSRVLAARDLQSARYAKLPLRTNAELSGRQLSSYCKLAEAEHRFLENAVEKLGLSARAFTRVLRIARTIADLEDAKAIGVEHLAEAIGYRNLDRRDIAD